MAMHQDPSENSGEPESEFDNPNLSEDELADMIDSLVNGHPIFEQPWVEDKTEPTLVVSPDGTFRYYFTPNPDNDIIFSEGPVNNGAFKASPVPDTLREWVEGKKA